LKKITTAFVLGAGLGTRLRPLTANCPKPLLPVRGKPMIEHVFERLAISGIQRFIVNTHHAVDCWVKVFPDNQWHGLPIVFRHEPVLLGTAGGLKNIADLIGQETILLHSGDVVTNLPLEPLLTQHANSEAEVTLALRDSETKTIGMDARHIIRQVGRGANSELSWYDYANVAVISAKFLQRIPDAQPRDLASVWRGMTHDNSLQGIVINEGYWHNIGTLDEYEKFHLDHREPQSSHGEPRS
jgi:mannose-1-phosphate guanylyltransferase